MPAFLVQAQSDVVEIYKGITVEDLFVVLSTAALSAVFVWLIEGIKERNRIGLVRKVIKTDLIKIKQLLSLLIEELDKSAKGLRKAISEIASNSNSKVQLLHQQRTFEEINREIYDSIPKTELFRAFKTKVILVTTIYLEIGFLDLTKPSRLIPRIKAASKEGTPTDINELSEVAAQFELNVATSKRIVAYIEELFPGERNLLIIEPQRNSSN
jgi:hypothetical protein